ncbi:tRNA (adenosine(37)-N6)-threonylcarbamoyltransferase complex dimerization subunit type 1 TsaB [Corynebacterium lowii]|uniref:tRNA threonylcarbamoyladenosine biosynthesis protein TsaB n=1 Tax=Corynebacterium lowii TaxID=1544413 RepID=A0A0Q0ZBN8_9CORY|nr:tRNA (adenosine(37)-N6)-threonylcarbamoyltransferase complex dimerization subunit type 1 TsaB [Corynebacterium lowii]KQB87438.1 tRNA threonylcarbamoyladenosine biosynthesis protein TsaB [Corynebacterium lowii]MDP9851970.1 tRNA threonylcarbamoyl adenosine modification protein YeaZ [Corynebacterium lowii]
MLVLTIDTATADLVTGIVDTTEHTVVSQRIFRENRAHNELLVPTIKEMLAEEGLRLVEMQAMVVGCGPGPFTGLRVGMVTAEALGHSLGLPVHGVCSLDAIGYQLREHATALVATDARRREVYWATYEYGKRAEGPDVVAPESLSVATPAHLSIPEHLVEKLPEFLAEVPRSHLGPTPASLVAVADLQAKPEPLQPLYLRRPDAKEPKQVPRSPAIPEVNKWWSCEG